MVIRASHKSHGAGLRPFGVKQLLYKLYVENQLRHQTLDVVHKSRISNPWFSRQGVLCQKTDAFFFHVLISGKRFFLEK